MKAKRRTRTAAASSQTFCNVARLIRKRKHPSAALCFERQAVFLQEPHESRRRKRTDRTYKKLRVARNVFQKLRGRAIVCYVASALSRDIDLFPRLFIFFKDGNGGARRSRGICRHEPGRTRADHCHFFHCRTTPHNKPRRKRIRPRRTFLLYRINFVFSACKVYVYARIARRPPFKIIERNLPEYRIRQHVLFLADIRRNFTAERLIFRL